MVDISRKMYQRNCIKTIVHSDGILSLNKKRVKEGLDHTKLHMTTVKYPSG